MPRSPPAPELVSLRPSPSAPASPDSWRASPPAPVSPYPWQLSLLASSSGPSPAPGPSGSAPAFPDPGTGTPHAPASSPAPPPLDVPVPGAWPPPPATPAPQPTPGSQQVSPPPPPPLAVVADNHTLTTPDQAGPPAHKSVVGVAAGSAAAATVLLVLALFIIVALRRRRKTADRSGDGDPAAEGAANPPPANLSAGSSSTQQLQSPAKDYHSPISPAAARPPQPQKPPPRSVEATPTPPTASSSYASSAAPAATPTESFQSQTKPDHPLDVLRPGGDGGEILFRGAFSYEELAAATNRFSDTNLVGRGGFGDVYVGTVDGGAAVAVKRLRAGSQQGDKEFQAELRIISRVHHRNLVSLVGYCVADGGQRLLVYEFVPNMTLHHHLHGEVEAVLDWPTRWKIAVGAAKGVAYLHEDCHPRIIHRDLKAANILLDPDFNPKVSDFGMAKFIPRGDTHIATRVVGTIGYLAPEYASSGKLTEKSDVFSYGVVLLEIITGMNVAMSSAPDTEDTLVSWARPLLTQALELHDYGELVDPMLASFDAVQMERLVRCAAAAVSTSARHRPRMSQIVRHLEGHASAEEIDACGVKSFGESGSAYGDASVQSHPMRYNEMRTSRRQARVKKLQQN